ncbi:hypothetical protein FA95DRAFT_1608430 [Auriscalpium vulgare]|uniref:Uncharacterized protein n=1 Tax=Auriscalpium vulgare TaxID=40419 RepID=A0ACB8RLL8_9AGAM|nr:hypothetical protein FA95DRAFT_1608430 [Auriscalpium vulgare]
MAPSTSAMMWDSDVSLSSQPKSVNSVQSIKTRQNCSVHLYPANRISESSRPQQAAPVEARRKRSKRMFGVAKTASTCSSSAATFNIVPTSTAATSNPCTLIVLIEDWRRGVAERAELAVCMDTGVDPTLGPCYWVDAGDVCCQLQGGPSRIEGSGKVFTMRGKYRQAILRIGLDGQETRQSVLLPVEESSMTLELFVESIEDPTPLPAAARQPTQAPPSSSDYLRLLTQASTRGTSPTIVEDNAGDTTSAKRKRRISTCSSDDASVRPRNWRYPTPSSDEDDVPMDPMGDRVRGELMHRKAASRRGPMRKKSKQLEAFAPVPPSTRASSPEPRGGELRRHTSWTA